MKLTLSKRISDKKSNLRQIRFQKDIPAVVYSGGEVGEKVIVSGSAFEAVLRETSKGHLPTTIFELELDGKKSRGIVKGIQYHPTTYQILHLDFLRLTDRLVEIKVPVVCVGEANCVGIKLGGFLRQVIRHIPIRCLPTEIPTDFKVDVKNLTINQSKRVRDIDMGEKIDPLINGGEVVVVIAKR